MNALLDTYLSRIELCEPQQFKNIVIVPLFTSANDAPEYLTLTEALQQRLATITEVSMGGQVPNVKVTNRSELCLLLLEGEELIGARQNRTLNTSLLLAGKSETVVPVSCTEAGRWSYQTTTFADAAYLSPHKLRKIKSNSVAVALQRQMGHKSDQHAVWGAVHELCLSSHVQSPTSSIHDAMAARARELEEFLANLKPLPNQKGLVVLVNGEIAGADMLSSARAYQVLHSKFIRSYALEALSEQKRAENQKSLEKVKSFFEASKASVERIHCVAGCGEDHRFEGPRLAGAALVAEGAIIHLNLYRN
jgi:hypothetical protein